MIATEQPKTGASLALPRREARSMRRRLRRRRHRMERMRNLFINDGLLTEEQLYHLYDGNLEDVYALRVKALDERLTDEEVAHPGPIAGDLKAIGKLNPKVQKQGN